jgi:hypothetical protein
MLAQFPSKIPTLGHLPFSDKPIFSKDAQFRPEKPNDGHEISLAATTKIRIQKSCAYQDLSELFPMKICCHTLGDQGPGPL